MHKSMQPCSLLAEALSAYAQITRALCSPLRPCSLLANVLSAHAQSTRALYQVAQPPRPCSLLADVLSAHAQSTRALYQVAQPPTTMQLACRCFECSRSPPGFSYFLHDLAFCVMIGRLLSTFVSHVRIRPLLIMKSWCSRIQCGAGVQPSLTLRPHLPIGCSCCAFLCVFQAWGLDNPESRWNRSFDSFPILFCFFANTLASLGASLSGIYRKKSFIAHRGSLKSLLWQ